MEHGAASEHGLAEFAGIVGYFYTPDEQRAALDRAREAGIGTVTAFLPLPDKSEVEAADPTESVVKYTGLLGGVTGILLALCLTVGTQWDYPLVVGGKPITSWPPFLVIMFEMMVLFGSFGAFFGWLIFAHLPHVIPEAGYDPAFAEDTFGVFIACRAEGLYRFEAEQILWECGAEKVREVLR